MMKQSTMLLVAVLIVVGVVGAGQTRSELRIYDLNLGKETSMSNAMGLLKQNRIILVGEHHSNKKHHKAQRNVIRTLKEGGMQVASGWRCSEVTASRHSIAGSMAISVKKNSSKYTTIIGIILGRPIA